MSVTYQNSKSFSNGVGGSAGAQTHTQEKLFTRKRNGLYEQNVAHKLENKC